MWMNKKFLIIVVFCFVTLNLQAKEIKKIISLMPAITENLYLLGLEDSIVGNTIYCIRPKAAKFKEKVALGKEVNLEKIVALEPDIIFASVYTDSKAVRKLQSLGFKVISFKQARNFSDICYQFLKLSMAVEKQGQAKKIIDKCKENLKEIKKRVSHLDKPKVFIQVGTTPLFTVGEDSPINELIEIAGGINVAKSPKSSIFSREQVLKYNPDYIFIVTMGQSNNSEKEIWNKFDRLTAVKNDTVFVMDSNKICSSTPVTFVEMAKKIAKIIHKGSGMDE